MTLTEQMWKTISPIRAAISDHPFLQELAAGTLPREIFEEYMTQDALYLALYGRVLAGLASMSSDPDDTVFWSTGARESIEVERALHASRVSNLDTAVMSATCTAYTSFVMSRLTVGDYGVAAAGVLPCYWVYQDVGDELLARAGSLDGHPYADWIGLYSDPAFAAQAARARSIVDKVGAASGDETRERMLDTFVTAARYEWMFWDAAWRREGWPV